MKTCTGNKDNTSGRQKENKNKMLASSNIHNQDGTLNVIGGLLLAEITMFTAKQITNAAGILLAHRTWV